MAKYVFWTEEARDKAKQQEHNKEFAETDMVVLLSYGKMPQQIVQNKKLFSAASNFLVDLSVVGTVKDFKEADTLLDYGVATILAIPGVSQVEKLRHIADFRKAYQTAKEAGDLKAAKEILELAQKAQKPPNHLAELAKKEKNIHLAVTTNFSTKQLDKKFKHAVDFGVDTTKKNPETLKHFQLALQNHLKDINTIQQGVYGVNKDPVYFNHKKLRFIVIDKNSNYVTGWKLDPNSNQFKNFIKNGFIK